MVKVDISLNNLIMFNRIKISNKNKPYVYFAKLLVRLSSTELAEWEFIFMYYMCILVCFCVINYKRDSIVF